MNPADWEGVMSTMNTTATNGHDPQGKTVSAPALALVLPAAA